MKTVPLPFNGEITPVTHEPLAGAMEPASREMTDHRRDIHVKKALTRFTRNKNRSDSHERLRYNLIAARVANGMLAVEAAAKFGYANSTQLSLIEAGKRTVPTDHQFVRQAVRIYSVSTDWLLGLSPEMELGVKLAQRFALLRGTREAFDSALESFARLSADVAHGMQLTPDEVSAAIAAVETVSTRFADLLDRGELTILLAVPLSHHMRYRDCRQHLHPFTGSVVPSKALTSTSITSRLVACHRSSRSKAVYRERAMADRI